MSQSTKIAAFLLFAFIVYVTLRGDLPAYMTVLGLRGDNSSPVAQTLATMASGANGLESFSFSPSSSSGGGLDSDLNDLFSSGDDGGLDDALAGLGIG